MWFVKLLSSISKNSSVFKGELVSGHNFYGVWGLGRSGKAAYEYLAQKGENIVLIDQRPVDEWKNDYSTEKVQCFQQDDPQLLNLVSEMNRIILSPGIPREHKVVKSFIEAGVPVINEIELAYEELKDKKFYAITGSNGKTTTVSLLGEIVKNSGKKVFVGGNIGTPLCESLLSAEEFDLYVLELSSFQIESLETFSPDIFALLNLTMTHEERYQSREDYLEAKIQLADSMKAHQQFFYHPSLLDDVKKRNLEVQIQSLGEFKKVLQKFDLSSFALAGEHNLENLSVAIAMAREIGADDQSIQKTINTFKPLSFRLENIGIKNGQQFFNDSKSTNIQSTQTALRSFEKGHVSLIIGGQVRDKEQINITDWQTLVDGVQELIVFGEVAKLFNQRISHPKMRIVDRLSNLEKNFLGDVVLFSPGFPSFDEFLNYQERGKFFNSFFDSI